MKILIFSDLHLHNHTYGATLVDYPSWNLMGINSRLLDGFKVFEQICAYLKDNSVDEIVYCGDLFHTHGKIDAGVLKVAFLGWETIMQYHKKPFHATALVGNHDTADKTMNTHALHWLEGLSVNVMDVPGHNAFNGLDRRLSYLPYTEDLDVITEFFAEAVKKGSNPVCFMHAGIDGVPMKSGFVPGSAFNTDMIPDDVQHVFSGHYHPHMQVTDKATVVGSALQINWADMGDKRGFIVYDTDTGEQEFHEIDAPRFVTFNMKGMGVADYTYQEKIGKPGLFDNNFVRVVDYHSGRTDDIREGLTGAGARSVEFVVKLEEVDRLQPLSSDGLHIPDAIKEYEEQKEVTAECRKVGEELRK
jgi:DNA repair exonuclease SbcCD nuclease subunit